MKSVNRPRYISAFSWWLFRLLFPQVYEEMCYLNFQAFRGWDFARYYAGLVRSRDIT